MNREISERRYRNQKQLGTKKQLETRADGAESPTTPPVPAPLMVPPDAPRQHFQATSTHPLLLLKSAKACNHWRKSISHQPPNHQPIPPENRPWLGPSRLVSVPLSSQTNLGVGKTRENSFARHELGVASRLFNV